MVELITLGEAAKYSDKRIKSSDVTIETFITTDNILPNKAGINKAVNLPPQGAIMPAYQQDNILVGNIRPYLKKIWFADRKGGCSADVLVFEVKKGYCPKYVYYTIFRNDFFHHMMRGSKGTRMPRGDKDRILDFLIPNYGLPTQNKISAVLSALDSKIKLNNRINAELEVMLETLYNYWFVQFDFPNENGKPYKSFCGKMEYNEVLKREIPRGWEVAKLSEYLEFEKGVEPGTKNYYETNENNELIPFYKVGDMENENSLWITSKIAGNSIAKEGDILISFDGTVGRIVIGLNGAFSSGIRRIYQKNRFFPKTYVYSLFQSQEIKKTIKKYAIGSNILHASGYIDLLLAPYSEEIVKLFEEKTKFIFEELVKNIRENKELAGLRDFLLPLLMNGQVKIFGD